MELKELLTLKKDINKKDFNPCIYFLFKGNKVVYVGQSKNGIARVFSHTIPDLEGFKKIFDGYAMIQCELSELNNIEAINIVKHKPKYNKAMPISDKVIMLNKYVSREIMLKMISDGCDFIELNRCTYIALKDFEEYYQKATYKDSCVEKINRLAHVLA